MTYHNLPAQLPAKVALRTADGLRIRTQIPCDLDRAALEYAALRFLAHNPRLLGYYAMQSCRLRFEKGRGGSQRFRCVAPAMLLELPGSWVRLGISVNREAVTVTALELLADYPRAGADR